MKKIIFLIALAISTVFSQAKGPINVSMSQKSAPLSFMENKGQVMDQNRNPRPDIQFSMKAAPGLNIFIGNGAIHYQFSNPDKLSPVARGKNHPGLKATPPKSGGEFEQPATYTMYRMDVELIGANANAEVVTEQKQDYYENYFNERTGEHGVTAFTYNRITYKNIYPHIDWVLYMKDGQLEHEFVIHEGVKASDIQLKYGGATDLKVNADGSLTATTPQGTITEQAPKSYQPDGTAVKSGFKLSGGILSYETGGFKGELVIDPSLIWSTYYGGNGDDLGAGIATDQKGNVYITGYTSSSFGIATSGGYQTVYNDSSDAFIAKFTSAGTIQWATYYGGSGQELSSGVATDGFGNAFIAGRTTSTSGITTVGAYQTNFAGDYDVFLAKFNSAGNIQWATYYGGNGYDHAYGITTDGLGNVYITGETYSTSGIATAGAYETVGYSSGGDGYLAKFNNSGALQWATYYGGQIANGYGVATDSSGNVYMTGSTGQSSGIATSGVYQTAYAGGFDAFLVKFNGSGSRLWGTYYGGSGFDFGANVTVDASQNVYFTGYTSVMSTVI